MSLQLLLEKVRGLGLRAWTSDDGEYLIIRDERGRVDWAEDGDDVRLVGDSFEVIDDPSL